LFVTEKTPGTPNAGDILVPCLRHNAFQGHMAVLHDDVNGRHGLDGTAVERREAEDGAELLPPDAIFV
jgi:hypothetical protein